MTDKNYGVIHEIGDYSNFRKLDEVQNEAYKQQISGQQNFLNENKEPNA